MGLGSGTHRGRGGSSGAGRGSRGERRLLSKLIMSSSVGICEELRMDARPRVRGGQTDFHPPVFLISCPDRSRIAPALLTQQRGRARGWPSLPKLRAGITFH